LRGRSGLGGGRGVGLGGEGARHADIILYLVDAAVGLTPDDELASYPEAIVVYTKTDLAPAPAGAIGIHQDAIEPLLAHLDDLVRESFAAPEGSLVNERQRVAVAECESALGAALASLDEGHEEQVVLVDLYRASTSLGLLTGATTPED